MAEAKAKRTRKGETEIEKTETTEEQRRFAALLAAFSDGVAHQGYGGIGVEQEKTLHALLKRYVCPDDDYHEVAVAGSVADVCIDGQIFEIQTGSFYPLRGKIGRYLERTDYRVTVVYPIAARKWLIWNDPETGDCTARRLSPRKGREADALKELFWLAPYLKNERLSVRLLLLELEEYRNLDGYSADRKKGSRRIDRMPIGLLRDCTLCGADAYRCFLEGLPEHFAAKDYAKWSHLRGRAVYSALNLFCELGLLERSSEKVGRSYVYRQTEKGDLKDS
jgi:hypothetical protein